MKPRTMTLIAAFIVGFLGYKMFAPSKVSPTAISKGVAIAEDSEDSNGIEDLEPKDSTEHINSNQKHDSEVSGSAESESIHADGLEPDHEDRSAQAGIIKVKVPEEYENRPGIVTLVANDESERERLDNVSQSFEEGRDAVQTFGDQLNALNGSYSGEIAREGREPCPMTLTIDGLYVPKEGQKTSDFTGNFSVQYNCPNGSETKGQFHNQFGGHVKAIGGEGSKSLLLKDNGGNYFQLNFSTDFHRITGFAYDSPQGAPPSLLGKFTASR